MAGAGAARRPVVLLVGAATRDLDATDPRGWRLGGGVTYGALAIARLGLPVRALVGLDDEARRASELDVLARAGVELEPFALATGPVFHNVEGESRRLQVCVQPSSGLPVSALPGEWRSSGAVVFAPVAGELDAGWATAFAHGVLVGLAWQGLLRGLAEGQPVVALPLQPHPLIRRADVAVASVEDVRAGDDVLLDGILLRRGQQLVLTNRAAPALWLCRTTGGFAGRLLPTLPVGQIRHPTGAGDVLLATWCACLAALRARGTDAAPWRSLAVALAAAAARVEAGGLVDTADSAELAARLFRLRREAW